MNRTYTTVAVNTYSRGAIDAAIRNVSSWEKFRTEHLPFCQGESLKAIIRTCNIPISKITRMALHDSIVMDMTTRESVSLYALDINYKNGRAEIFIADDGCKTMVIASDFEPKQTLQN